MTQSTEITLRTVIARVLANLVESTVNMSWIEVVPHQTSFFPLSHFRNILVRAVGGALSVLFIENTRPSYTYCLHCITAGRRKTLQLSTRIRFCLQRFREVGVALPPPISFSQG